MRFAFRVVTARQIFGYSALADLPENDVTHLLSQAASGDKRAADELLPLVYSQLRRLAQQRMAAENPGHTLQATALVHEAYVKLLGPRKIPWQNEAHFYKAAAESIRRILVDHARAKGAKKRSGGGKRVILNVVDLATEENSELVLPLDDALTRLEKEDPDTAEIVRLRFYAGLSIDQTAKAVGLSPRTVDRRWKYARAWLHHELEDSE